MIFTNGPLEDLTFADTKEDDVYLVVRRDGKELKHKVKFIGPHNSPRFHYIEERRVYPTNLSREVNVAVPRGIKHLDEAKQKNYIESAINQNMKALINRADLRVSFFPASTDDEDDRIAIEAVVIHPDLFDELIERLQKECPNAYKIIDEVIRK